MKMKSSRYFFLLLLPVTLFLVLGLSLKSRQQQCANSISCIENLDVAVENDSVAIFNGMEMTPPKIDLALDSVSLTKSKVLGEKAATGEKKIYVDLTNQTLYAYQGENLYMQALVSTGKWYPTPTGEFKIWIKLRSTRMSGGSGSGYYNLPNVPYTMFFAGNNAPQASGFALHGAYWHNNFGHPMSHGCINMKITDAKKLFEWVEDPNETATIITVYGKAQL